GRADPSLRAPLIPGLFDFAARESALTGWDACVWGVGVSSIGRDEASYASVTEELTLQWARALLRLNPGFSFCYCSAMGADGKGMWARGRRRVEDGLKAMPFKHSGCVRAGCIRPGPGFLSGTKSCDVGLMLTWRF